MQPDGSTFVRGLDLGWVIAGTTSPDRLADLQERRYFRSPGASMPEDATCHNRAFMTQPHRLPVGVAKRDFRRLLEAAGRGQRTVILRHGRPVAELGPLRNGRPDLPIARRPGGLLALLGAFGDWDTIDADIEAIVAERDAAADRPAAELE